MKTVFLIGNGFDVSQGLKTRYSDFRDDYKKLETKDKDIMAFISRVEKEELADEKWSDLEIALGRHTDVFTGDNIVEDAISFHDKLSAAIFSYVKRQNTDFKISETAITNIQANLAMPESQGRLTPVEVESFKKFKSQWRHTSQWHTRIITFNYTDTIWKCFKKTSSQAIHLGNVSGNNQYLADIEHIHGYHDRRQIIGVNDESQIANKSLHGTYAMKWYLKTQNNATNGQGCQQKCIDWINVADLICIYGMSYGETDLLWWQAIVRRLIFEHKTRLIIFVFDSVHKYNGNQEPHKLMFKNKIKNQLIAMYPEKLTDAQKLSLETRIIVAYNTNMFQNVDVE